MGNKQKPQSVNELEIDGLGIVKTGDKLKHSLFGKGVAEEMYIWDSGERTIRVLFDKHGSKALVPEFAKLKRRKW